MPIDLPPSGTVLYLNGANFNLTDYVPDQLCGIFKGPTYRLSRVEYPASLFYSIPRGVKALDAALRSTPGPKIVLAHSQGAQVASRWIREHADSPIDELTFVLTGNPIRNPTGRYISRGTEATPLGPWPIIDVARQYDGFAIASDAFRSRLGMMLDHPRYDVVDLFNPQNVVTHRGNTTFVTAA